MNRSLKYGLAFLLLGVVAAVILLSPEPPRNKKSGGGKTPQEVSQNRESSDQQNLANERPVKDGLSAGQLSQIEQSKGKSKLERMQELLRRDYNTPIDFWGKVVDQNGNPIADVKAEIVVDEQAGNREHVVFSDGEGLFELLGKRGARARVEVSLDGYAPTSDEKIGPHVSSRTIYYSTEAMPPYAPPTRDDPQIFVLRKKHPAAKLAHSERDHVPVDRAGSPQKIELQTEGKTIEIEVRCWSSCPVPFTFDKYDWRAEIEVVGGSLRAINEFDPVTAPTDGYQPVFKVEMPKNMEQNWIRSSPNGTRNFWIQFDDGTYAKARIEVRTGRKHEVNAEVWYNLDGTNIFEQ